MCGGMCGRHPIFTIHVLVLQLLLQAAHFARARRSTG